MGPIPVLIRAKDGKPVFAQLTAAMLPEIKDPPPPPETLCEILSLEPSHIVADDMIEPEAVSCGVPYLFIPIKKPEMLSWVKVDTLKWEQALRDYWAPEMFVFSTEEWGGIFEGGHIRARMFAPGLGIGEDPATGQRLRRARRISRAALRERAMERCAGRWIRESRWEGRAGSSWRSISSAASSRRSRSAENQCS